MQIQFSPWFVEEIVFSQGLILAHFTKISCKYVGQFLGFTSSVVLHVYFCASCRLFHCSCSVLCLLWDSVLLPFLCLFKITLVIGPSSFSYEFQLDLIRTSLVLWDCIICIHYSTSVLLCTYHLSNLFQSLSPISRFQKSKNKTILMGLAQQPND